MKIVLSSSDYEKHQMKICGNLKVMFTSGSSERLYKTPVVSVLEEQ